MDFRHALSGGVALVCTLFYLSIVHDNGPFWVKIMVSLFAGINLIQCLFHKG